MGLIFCLMIIAVNVPQSGNYQCSSWLSVVFFFISLFAVAEKGGALKNASVGVGTTHGG